MILSPSCIGSNFILMKASKGEKLLVRSTASRILDGGWKDMMASNIISLINSQGCERVDFDLSEKRQEVLKLVNDVLRKRDVSMFDDLQKALKIVCEFFCKSLEEFQNGWFQEFWFTISTTLGAINRLLNSVPGKTKECDIYPGCIVVDLTNQDQDHDLEEFNKDWDVFCLGMDTFSVTKEDAYYCSVELFRLAAVIFTISRKYCK